MKKVKLTVREAQILELVLMGYSIRESASMLSISPKTVSIYRGTAYRTLGVHNRVELMKWALERGVLKVNWERLFQCLVD